MDANRTYLLAQNGVPGEYTTSHPVHTPKISNANETMKRHDSADSLDSLAREKDEAHTVSAPRSGLRSALSKITHSLSGAGKEKRSTGDSSHQHERFQVYVVGDQVVYLGPGSNRRARSKNEVAEKVENTDLEKERKTSPGR